MTTRPTIDDRTMRAFRELVLSCFPELVYLAEWEYEVTSATDTTITGRPTSTDFPLDDVHGVEIRPTIAGSKCTPVVGSLVTIRFINADPSRPVLASYDGNMPDDIAIDASRTITVGPTAAVNAADALEIVIRSSDAVTIDFPSASGLPPLVGRITWGPTPLLDPVTLPTPSRLKG